MDAHDPYPEDDEPGGKQEETKRLTRLLRLISLVSNGPCRWTRRRLAMHLGVSERQIDKDLQVIRHGLCFELAHTPKGYYFTQAPELQAIHYTPSETLALLGALVLAQHSGLLDATSLGAALARTEAALPGVYFDLVRSLRQRGKAQTERQRHQAEIHRLVRTGLVERRRVRVLYESTSADGAREREWCPYHLEPYEGSWLLIARDSVKDDVRYFKLNRVLRATLLEDRYEIPADFDLEAYRGTGWGILRDMASDPVAVVLRLDPAEGRRVRDDIYHESQREERQADGSWLVRFRVGITPELVRWVFRWGTGCEVLAPPELRAMVAEQARRIAALNSGDSVLDSSMSNFGIDDGNSK